MTKDAVHYIRWQDACYHPDYNDVGDIGEPVEIEECGFLVKETESAVTISVEHHKPEDLARLTLTIPKVNIIEWREFKIPRKAKKRWPVDCGKPAEKEPSVVTEQP